MSDLTPEQVADAMFDLVNENAGKKKFRPTELNKAMKDKFGNGCDRNMCKAATKILIDSGRLIYTFYSGTFIEIPQTDKASNE